MIKKIGQNFWEILERIIVKISSIIYRRRPTHDLCNIKIDNLCIRLLGDTYSTDAWQL